MSYFSCIILFCAFYSANNKVNTNTQPKNWTCNGKNFDIWSLFWPYFLHQFQIGSLYFKNKCHIFHIFNLDYDKMYKCTTVWSYQCSLTLCIEKIAPHNFQTIVVNKLNKNRNANYWDRMNTRWYIQENSIFNEIQWNSFFSL